MGRVVKILLQYTVLEEDSEVLLGTGIERKGWIGELFKRLNQQDLVIN